jgi:protoporphyrin/coproporphyrin ferrochelatase
MSAPPSTALATRTGVVLVNIGTPDAPTVPAVRRYLKEFLSDPKVIDLPAVLRWLLLNLIILPFRPRKSAHAYQQIWTEHGSPLLLHAKSQVTRLQALLPGFEVALAMRYGNPSLSDAIAGLRARGVTSLTVLPMYPQYASATTSTTVERVAELAGDLPLNVVPEFHATPGFIEAYADNVRATVAASNADHVLFSYHGLPVRQLKPFCVNGGGCSSACEALKPDTAKCYRAQCYATSRAIAQAAKLSSTSTAFQSRLKGATWLQPFTDETVVALARQGVKRLAVACPSFVADCLETLEEIGLRAAASFKAAGGERLTLVPAVNSSEQFLAMLAEQVKRSS